MDYRYASHQGHPGQFVHVTRAHIRAARHLRNGGDLLVHLGSSSTTTRHDILDASVFDIDSGVRTAAPFFGLPAQP
jgi:hypothetical protein